MNFFAKLFAQLFAELLAKREARSAYSRVPM